MSGHTILRTTCSMMPNQIEGTLDDGRNLYFRARHGSWALYIFEGDSIPWDEPVAEGDEREAGWWGTDEAMDFCIDRLDEVTS